MSGKRLLDAIQFLNVSKTVAAKHLSIRQHQLDVYTRTSSLTKGIKAQTEGLILTAQAAAALARRFDEPSPPSDSANSHTPPSADLGTSASTSANTTTTTTTNTAGVTSTSPPPDQARRLQRQAESQVPAQTAQYVGDEKPDALNVSKQQDVFYQPSSQSAPDLSSLPRVKVPKVAGGEQVVADGLNADVFHSPVESETAKKVEEGEEMSEEMIQGLFHSPRVSRMMSGKPAPRREWKLAETKAVKSETQEMEELAASVAEDVVPSAETVGMPQTYQMLESRVPSSRLGRLWQYGGLATSMAFGAVGEGFRRATGSQDSGSIMFSPGNMERMVAKLSKMRGAALKLGQMLSIQGMLHSLSHYFVCSFV
jgi:aarF domain-containing kinase